jgi:hypothetical protein
MNKLAVFFFGLFLSLTILSAYAVDQNAFCLKDGRKSSTIALHSDGTAEWTKKFYGHEDAPCGIDPAYATYLKGTYLLDPVKKTIRINYPGSNHMSGPIDYVGSYSFSNNQIQELHMNGEFGGTFNKLP